jgi:uncharacterized membrane protein YdjX (TVP38/TMEM64 family)
MRINSQFKKLLIAALLFAIAYLIMILVLREVGLENTHTWIKKTGVWAPILFVIICSGSLVIAPLSGSSLFIVGGALFGKEMSFILSFISNILGCNINFWISRKLGQKAAIHLIGKSNLQGLNGFLSQLKGHHSIAYMTLIMPLSQDIVSYAIGLTDVKYWQFFIALSVSSLAIVATYIYLGTSLLETLVQ